MKNVIKTLFVAIVAMSVTFAYAQDTKKKPAPKKEKMEKKTDGKMDKKDAKKPAKKKTAKKKKPAAK
jgi:hypothetical protein